METGKCQRHERTDSLLIFDARNLHPLLEYYKANTNIFDRGGTVAGPTGFSMPEVRTASPRG
jgi:hypothetical protein